MPDNSNFQLKLVNAETIPLGETCIGVIWQLPDGWHGCLKWDIDDDTDFVGPLPDRQAAIEAITAAYADSIESENPV